MGLNKSTGNMYEFVTHTWNTIKGKCEHDCGYCYMKRFEQNDIRFDEKELKTDLGSGNVIFVGSSNDMFSISIPSEWILKTLEHMGKFDNEYILQTKNPERVLDFIEMPVIKDKCSICTTIETNRRYYPEMGLAPLPIKRAIAMFDIHEHVNTYVTIEPIMDFDIYDMVKLIDLCSPLQVNIGSDTRHCELDEPPRVKVDMLISQLRKFTKVHLKSNLKRLK